MATRGFFERQARARRNTKLLVLLFILAVAGVLLGVNAVVVLGLHGEELADPAALLPTIIGTSALVLLLIVGAMLLKISQLSTGGSAVAQALGGSRVDDDTRDPQLRRLRNVVEEMAIASGVPVPAVFVLENEPGINAFAAGHTTSDAAVAVTRGCLDRLGRDELQAVIAHEFSHILNGDMRLNIQLMGWLFGILVLAIVGQKIIRSAHFSRDGRSRAAAFGIGLALIVIGYIGVFFGHLIKAAVSRSREYLADASAVQFTRDSSALAGALKKIAGIPAGGLLQDPGAEEVSHMLFAQGLRSRLFATHPPIFERIAALEPGFNAKAFAAQKAAWAQRYDGREVPGFVAEQGVDGETEEVSAGSAPVAAAAGPAPVQSATSEPSRVTAAAAPAPFSPQTPADDPAVLLASIGELREDPLRMAKLLRDAIPEALLRVARSPGGAVLVLLALLLDDDELIRTRQLESIVSHLSSGHAAQADRLRPRCASLHPLQRTPLAAIALPAARRISMMQLHALRELVPELIHADGRIDMHEYVIGAMLETQLDDALRPGRRQLDPQLTLKTLGQEVGLLLAVMARAGHADEAEAQAALSAGQAKLPAEARVTVNTQDWHLRLDGALRRLDALSPARKQLLIEALIAATQHDQTISVHEYELLRAVCAALHCPMPSLGAALSD